MLQVRTILRLEWLMPILFLSLILGGPKADGAENRPYAGRPYAGRPLEEVLGELRDGGLEIFFTSHLVRPEMRVVEEPTATRPRRILGQILAPHGLEAVAGPGGRLVVVVAPKPAVVRGLARERQSGVAIPGVRLVLKGAEREAWSTRDGSFLLDDLAPGTYDLQAHLPGFVVTHRELELGNEGEGFTLEDKRRLEVWGLKQKWNFTVGEKARTWQFRIEAYQRLITDPRPRYENIFEPISIFPEIEPDRILIRPESGEARGIELFLKGRLSDRLDGWVSYTYSEIEDRVDGRAQPRRIDQPHALNVDLNWRAGEHWNVNLAWRYHTGWPTSSISGRLEVDDEGEEEFVPVIGPFYAERLPSYHRLDLRASREWKLKKGVLGFYVEIQNVYDRENIAGFDIDFEFELNENGEIDVFAAEEVWGGFLPSFGFTWEF